MILNWRGINSPLLPGGILRAGGEIVPNTKENAFGMVATETGIGQKAIYDSEGNMKYMLEDPWEPLVEVVQLPLPITYSFDELPIIDLQPSGA